MMELKIFCCLILILPLPVAGQSVEVTRELLRIEGANRNGYQVRIAAPEEEVNNSLARFMKTFGKTKTSGGYITVAEPLIDGRQYSQVLYATTKYTGNTSFAWFGFLSENNEQAVEARGEKLAREFGVAFHREKIQLQIDESVRALQAVEKQQQRLANQNKDLKNRVEGNKREKIQLEKSLIQNKIELDDLTRKLAANAKAQDSVATATDQIRKVVEMHKERQKQVQ